MLSIGDESRGIPLRLVPEVKGGNQLVQLELQGQLVTEARSDQVCGGEAHHDNGIDAEAP
jgi:hypothetical protein